MPQTFVMPNVRIPEREERRLPRQCNSQKGKFIADSSQGSCRIVAQGQRALSPRCYPNLQSVHKQLVAGLSGLVTCLQSNLIGPNLHGLLFKLGRSRAFQLSPDRFPLSYQVHIDQLAPGGLIIMLPWKTRPTPTLGCLSWCQPWQPRTFTVLIEIQQIFES